jgi:hypothetical protein
VNSGIVKKVLGKIFFIFVWVMLRTVLLPFWLYFDYCLPVTRLHKLFMWLAFLWIAYIFPVHGHDWIESVRCYWGWNSCGRYAPPTAAEIWWRQSYMRVLVILAGLAWVNFYIQHIKREMRLRRQLANDPDIVIPLPWWKPKWLDKYFWWL